MTDWGLAAKESGYLIETGFYGPGERGTLVREISNESYGDGITKYCGENAIPIPFGT